MMTHPSSRKNATNYNYYQGALVLLPPLSSSLSSNYNANSLDHKAVILLCKISSKDVVCNDEDKEIEITKTLLSPLARKRCQFHLRRVACSNTILGDISGKYEDEEEEEEEEKWRDSDIGRVSLRACIIFSFLSHRQRD